MKRVLVPKSAKTMDARQIIPLRHTTIIRSNSGMSTGQARNEHICVRNDVDRPRDHIAQQQLHQQHL